MRLACYRFADRDRIGVSPDGETLIDLAAAGIVGSDLLAVIEGGADAARSIESLLKDAAGKARHACSEVEWHPPVRRPSKICCVALNNSANSERIISGPKHPAFFIKPNTALVGHGGAIECRPEFGRVHPEPELAAVIGKTAKRVRAADAMDHVFGYTIHNDITSPTMRREDTFHYRAIHPKGDDGEQVEYVESWVSYPGRYKGADTFSPMGPWIVTRDEIPDPHDLRIASYHDDRLVTEDSTANLFYKLPEVIEYISAYLTLLPGDIVSLGTALKSAEGGAAVQNIDLNRLGGSTAVEIEGVGRLTNPVTRAGG
jgi:2-keto-4-pentenoate hydratase/2-oxohepta-3-ene-1,7-dioic acid hydratase in catechol pathway